MTAATVEMENNVPLLPADDSTPGSSDVMRHRIDFIPNAGFRSTDDEPNEAVDEVLAIATKRLFKAPVELPAHLRRLCEPDLLTHEQEMALFREMNYLKFQASVLRSQLDPDLPDPETLTAIQSRLSRAEAIRDHIIKANMRLVISVVKKFVTPQQSFDDMLSDGTYTLMQAVDKFDFDRGFRFSTYAYRSIARTAFRAVQTARAEDARMARDAGEWGFELEDDRRASSMSDQVWSNLRELTAAMLQQLDRREQFIIRSRYALGAHRKARTFQFLADKLGISKERARQLEKRAVDKLRNLASEFDMDDLFGAAMV